MLAEAQIDGRFCCGCLWLNAAQLCQVHTWHIAKFIWKSAGAQGLLSAGELQPAGGRRLSSVSSMYQSIGVTSIGAPSSSSDSGPQQTRGMTRGSHEGAEYICYVHLLCHICSCCHEEPRCLQHGQQHLAVRLLRMPCGASQTVSCRLPVAVTL